MNLVVFFSVEAQLQLYTCVNDILSGDSMSRPRAWSYLTQQKRRKLKKGDGNSAFTVRAAAGYEIQAQNSVELDCPTSSACSPTSFPVKSSWSQKYEDNRCELSMWKWRGNRPSHGKRFSCIECEGDGERAECNGEGSLLLPYISGLSKLLFVLSPFQKGKGGTWGVALALAFILTLWMFFSLSQSKGKAGCHLTCLYPFEPYRALPCSSSKSQFLPSPQPWRKEYKICSVSEC